MTQMTHWTAATRAAFIASLAECGEVRAALATVGLSPKSAYRLRALDPDFARAWDAALLHSRQAVVAELTSRALHGWQEEVWFRGELVGTRTRHDNRLLLALLARLDSAAGKEDETRVRRAAPHFADVLAAMRHDMPLAPWFAASQAEKQEDAINQACRRQRFWHYAALMDEEQIDEVMGFGPINDTVDDDEDDDGEPCDYEGDEECADDGEETGKAAHDDPGASTAAPDKDESPSAAHDEGDFAGATDLMPSTEVASPAHQSLPSRGCYLVLPMTGQSPENRPSAAIDQEPVEDETLPRPIPPAPEPAKGPPTELETEAMEGDMAQLFQQRFAVPPL